jgi:hypothetical protein
LPLMAVRSSFLIARNQGWDEIVTVSGFDDLMDNPPPEFKFLTAAGYETSALAIAQNHRAEPAMQLIAMLPEALGRGASRIRLCDKGPAMQPRHWGCSSVASMRR